MGFFLGGRCGPSLGAQLEGGGEGGGGGGGGG